MALLRWLQEQIVDLDVVHGGLVIPAVDFYLAKGETIMEQKFRFRSVLTAAALACGLVLTGVGAHADVIKIAAVGPMTGPVTQLGDQIRNGTQTAIEMINAAGGVNGHKFEMVAVDDACEPKQSPIAANKIVNEGIHFTVGMACSGAAIAATDIYENEGVVMITSGATSPLVTQGKGYHYIFRTIGRDDQQGPLAAKFIAETVKPSLVVVLHDKQSYGQGIATSVYEDLKRRGLKIAFFEGLNPGDSDYSAIITRIKSSGADFVYFGGYHPEIGLLVRQAAEQGLKVQFMGPEVIANSELSAIAGPAAEGLLLTFPADFASDPENAKILAQFTAKKRDADGAFTFTSFAAVQAIAEAIRQTNSTDPDDIAQYLHSHTVETVIGKKTAWDAQGDVKDFRFQVFRWHVNGPKTLAQ